MADDALVEIADALYALPLADFTPARDGRARELRSEDRALSERVKKLRKPSVAAWVVNLLVRRDAGQVDEVLTLGEALREAQSGLDGDELRALTRQRRQLTAAVTAGARSLAADSGHRVSDAVAEQVQATLTAAMVDAAAAEEVRSGLLVTALVATGVDAADLAGALALDDVSGVRATPLAGPAPALSSTGPPSTGPGLHVVPDPEADQKALRLAEEQLTEAADGLERATAALDAADADRERLEARSLELQSGIDELRRRLADLENDVEEVDEELSEAEEARERAQGERDAAATAHESARSRVDELREPLP